MDHRLRRIAQVFDLQTLGGRYLAVTLVLALVVVLVGGWSDRLLERAGRASTLNIEERHQVERLTWEIRNAVWDASEALESYMISPTDETRSVVEWSMEVASGDAAALARVRWIESGDQGDRVASLQSGLRRLDGQLETLMDVRIDPVALHPSVAVMMGEMLPANELFISELKLARQELSPESGDDGDLALYMRLEALQDSWRRLIGAFRVMVASRFGAFVDPEEVVEAQAGNVDVIYPQIRRELDLLAAMDERGELGLQASASLEVMRKQAERWYRSFHEVKDQYLGVEWRTDLPLLENQVQPLFAEIWTSLTELGYALGRSSTSDVTLLASAGRQMRVATWLLASVVFVFLLAGYALLRRTVTTPVARVTHALWSDARGEKGGEIPRTGTREMHELVEAFSEMRREVKLRQLALEHQSLHDGLTALPNREYLQRRLRESITTSQRDGGAVALMLMDLDHFKEINDTLGHPVGDHILKEVATRLLRAVGPTETVARLGGDEFAIVLPGTDRADCQRVAKSLVTALDREFEVGGHRLFVGASIGIALFPEDGHDVAMLLRHADVAMYLAKQTGRTFAFYDEGEDTHSVAQLNLVKDLHAAISESKLHLCYQPKQDLRRGHIVGVEALLRWQHPQHGLVPPDRIVPVAERTGLIQALTHWVLDTALNQCQEWREAGLDLNVAVNLSVYDLQDSQLPDHVAHRLAVLGLPPDALGLEITESAMMADPQRAMDVLFRLHQMGVRLAIDDFGTGFSSLSYLKKLPVSELKIDKSFIFNMHEDENDAAIVHSTIDLGHNLGLDVVAEGIEADHTLTHLRELGCDIVQGFHLCRPLPAHELTQWLHQRRLRSVGAV